MAQLPGSPRSNEYIASAGQSVFTYTYRIHSDEEITVSQNGVVLTLTTDYTVQNAGEPTGGTITLTASASDGDVIVLAGNTYIQRITEFQNNGDFLASAINGEYNVLDDITSEILTTGTAGFHLDTPSVLIDTGVPSPAPRRCLVWNDAGTKIEMSTYDPDLAQGSAAEAAASAAAALISENDAAASAAAAEYWASTVDLENLASGIVPSVDGTYSLGSVDKNWFNIHVKDIYVADSVDATNSVFAGNVIKSDTALQAGPDVGGVFKADDTVNTVDINGDLDISSTFTVEGATGNTVIDGTLSIAGRPIVPVQRAIFADVKNYNVDGGSFTDTSWRVRDLNTTYENNISGSYIAGNQIHLPAGDYFYEAKMPAVNVSGHIGVLYNLTAGAKVGEKDSSHTITAYENNFIFPRASFTITEESIFELWHKCKVTCATYGFGKSVLISGEDSVYTMITITKE